MMVHIWHRYNYIALVVYVNYVSLAAMVYPGVHVPVCKKHAYNFKGNNHIHGYCKELCGPCLRLVVILCAAVTRNG